MSAFKCNSCSIQFPNSDSQRYHMKTDWHRYNLKRRVAGLAPVDAAVFAEKVQESKLYEQEVDEFGFKVLKPRENKKLHIHHKSSHRGRPIDLVESVTDRGVSPASTVATDLSHFSLGESVYSHANTHSDLDSNFETASEADTEHSAHDGDYVHSDDSDEDDESYLHDEHFEEEPLQPITSCIYCGIPHHDVETNVTHMFQKHGLYIPERSYLVDLKGLLEHLISIIVIDNECLCCGFKGRNLESIRQHTASKGHCRLPYESKEEKLELARFYDFSSIDSEVTKSKSKKKVGFSKDADETLKDASEEESDVDVEDEDGDTHHNGINDNYTVARIDPVDSQLTLPNGHRLGHRSLNRIYRQTIHIPPEPSNGQLTVAVADRRLTSGFTLQQHNKEERATQILETRAKSKQVNRDVRRLNFQPHYREEKLQ